MANTKTNPIIDGLFGFDGRMRRSEYWLISIGLGILKGVSAFALMMLIGGFSLENRDVVEAFVELLFLWPALALMVKRGHDRNRSAVYSIVLLALFLVLGVGLGLAGAMERRDLLAFAALAVVALGGYVFIDYGFMDGTHGRNRYGLSPKYSEVSGERLVLDDPALPASPPSA